MNTTNGFRRVPARGDAEQRQFLPLLGVTNSQTIYWSVQAMDAGFAGGPFASEVSEVTIPQINILPNTATNALLLWTPPTFGWVLQTSPDHAPAAWSNAPSGALNPVLIPLTNAPKTFYRLGGPQAGAFTRSERALQPFGAKGRLRRRPDLAKVPA